MFDDAVTEGLLAGALWHARHVGAQTPPYAPLPTPNRNFKAALKPTLPFMITSRYGGDLTDRDCHSGWQPHLVRHLKLRVVLDPNPYLHPG